MTLHPTPTANRRAYRLKKLPKDALDIMKDTPEMTKRYWSTHCAPHPTSCWLYSQPPLCSKTTAKTHEMRITSSNTQRFMDGPVRASASSLSSRIGM